LRYSIIYQNISNTPYMIVSPPTTSHVSITIAIYPSAPTTGQASQPDDEDPTSRHATHGEGHGRDEGMGVGRRAHPQVQRFLLFITLCHGTNYFTTDKPPSPVVGEMASPNSRKPP